MDYSCYDKFKNPKTSYASVCLVQFLTVECLTYKGRQLEKEKSFMNHPVKECIQKRQYLLWRILFFLF